MVRTRNAILPDVEQIHTIIRAYSGNGTLLPRTLAELRENVRDFMVAEDADGKIVGCGALHLYGMHLAEIRSIAVIPGTNGMGAGRKLVEALMEEATRHEVTCVCLFTRIPTFFAYMGFSVAKRDDLPDKIYKDCIHCPAFNACDEIAMYRGEIPNHNGVRDLQIPKPLVKLTV
jgi:amino-acid N-acetyltransferase